MSHPSHGRGKGRAGRRRDADTAPLPDAADHEITQGGLDEVVPGIDLGPVEEFTLTLPPGSEAAEGAGEETRALLFDGLDDTPPVSRVPPLGDAPTVDITRALPSGEQVHTPLAEAGMSEEPLRRVVMPSDLVADRSAPASSREAGSKGPRDSRPVAVTRMASASVKRAAGPELTQELTQELRPGEADDDKTQARIVRPPRTGAPPAGARPRDAARVERRATYRPGESAPVAVESAGERPTEIRIPKAEARASGSPRLATPEDLEGEVDSNYQEPLLAWVASAIGISVFAVSMLFLGGMVSFLLSN